MTASISFEQQRSGLLIRRYGARGFVIGEQSHDHPIIITPKDVRHWHDAPPDGETVGMEHLGDCTALQQQWGPQRHVMLIGCGAQFMPSPAGLGDALRASNMNLEWMNTGAACRTWNVLMGEGRAVIAALLPVPLQKEPKDAP